MRVGVLETWSGDGGGGVPKSTIFSILVRCPVSLTSDAMADSADDTAAGGGGVGDAPTGANPSSVVQDAPSAASPGQGVCL